MRNLLLILSGVLLLLTSTPIFAAQGGASGQVKVTADVISINYMKLTPTQDMRMPSVYTNYGQGVTGGQLLHSTDATKVIGGLSGQNAMFSVTGEPGQYYNVRGVPEIFLYDDQGHQLKITFEQGEAGSPWLEGVNSYIKQLDANGNDTISVGGKINFDGLQPAGSYNNYANPAVFTVDIDRAYTPPQPEE